MQAVEDGDVGRIKRLVANPPGNEALSLGMHPDCRLASTDFCQCRPRHGRTLDALLGAGDHLDRLTDGHCRIRVGDTEQQRQGLLAQLLTAADKLEVQRRLICQGASGNQCLGNADIVSQRLHGEAGRIDDFKQHLLGVDHLPGQQVMRGADDAGCRCHEGFGGVDAGPDIGPPLLQGGMLDARRLDLLLRHGAFELLEALHLALGDGQLRFEFCEAGFLVATLDGTADRSQVDQDFALGDLSSGRRHALWARDDAAGEHGLHPTAGFRIGNNLAIQFDRRRQFGDTHRLGTQAELALHRLRHEQTAVGQPLQRCSHPGCAYRRHSGRRLLLGVLTVIFVPVSQGCLRDHT